MLKNKKLIVTMLFLALILVVAACGGGGDDEGSSGSDSGGESAGESTEDSGGGSAAEGDVDNGAKVYENNCLSCHGKEGAGGSAPGLQGNDVASDYDKTVKQVKNGGGGMPPFEGNLSKQEIADVSTYLTEKIAPMGK